MTFPATKSSEVSDSSKNGRKSTSADRRQGKNVDRFGTFDEVESGSQMQKDYNRTLQQSATLASPELYRAKVKQSELILFTTQLSVMLDSGVVLSDALDAIAEQAEHGTFKMIIMDVAQKVKSGDNFSKALAGYSKVFNSMFISMVKASEASGRMAEMLNVLSGYLDFPNTGLVLGITTGTVTILSVGINRNLTINSVAFTSAGGAFDISIQEFETTAAAGSDAAALITLRDTINHPNSQALLFAVDPNVAVTATILNPGVDTTLILSSTALGPAGEFPLSTSHPAELVLSGPTLVTTDGFFAQTGIFLEPSFPRPVFDLTPSGNAHLVDADHSLTTNDIGMRNLELLIGFGAGVPGSPEQVIFEIRRIRRFHDVLDVVGENLTPLRFAYEIRRGRITDYTHNVGGKQFGIVEADSFVMNFNTDFPLAPRAGDVWNTGKGHLGTNLASFTDPNTNINVGDLFRVLDENGAVIDEVEVAGFVETGLGGLSGTELKLAPPGLTALTPAEYPLTGGLRFEIYLRQPAVPHEQSNEQLLELITFQDVTRTNADYTTQLGGYVPQIQTGETLDVVSNRLFDDLNTDTFSLRGVRIGDIVVVDPAGTLPQSGGLPVVPEKGTRPFGDAGVEDRPTDYTAGTPNPIDDNRGFYRVVEVVDTPTPHLIVSGESSFSGTQILDTVFPESVGDRAAFGYTIYPTVTGSVLNSALYVDTGTPDSREGQMDLRPTRLPDPTTNSYDVYSNPVTDPGQDYSIRPFSYRVIRPSALFSDNAVDLILSTRERMLSLIELLGSSTSGQKQGSYFVFQQDQHAHDVGSPTDPEVGLGVLSNLLIEGLVGRMDVVPFANTADALSLLDRRFWILDRQLDTLTAKDSVSARKAGFGDTPYTAYLEDPGGSSVRPVLPDRVDIVLNVEDRTRSFRFTWLAYRTHRILGTLAAIQRFDDQLPERLKEEERLLQILASTETAG